MKEIIRLNWIYTLVFLALIGAIAVLGVLGSDSYLYLKEMYMYKALCLFSGLAVLFLFWIYVDLVRIAKGLVWEAVGLRSHIKSLINLVAKKDLLILHKDDSIVRMGKRIERLEHDTRFGARVQARRYGNTTRMIDAYIQLLFKEGEILVRDHHGTIDSTKLLVSRLRTRLKHEHTIARVEVKHEGDAIRIKLTEKS